MLPLVKYRIYSNKRLLNFWILYGVVIPEGAYSREGAYQIFTILIANTFESSANLLVSSIHNKVQHDDTVQQNIFKQFLSGNISNKSLDSCIHTIPSNKYCLNTRDTVEALIQFLDFWGGALIREGRLFEQIR